MVTHVAAQPATRAEKSQHQTLTHALSPNASCRPSWLSPPPLQTVRGDTARLFSELGTTKDINRVYRTYDTSGCEVLTSATLWLLPARVVLPLIMPAPPPPCLSGPPSQKREPPSHTHQRYAVVAASACCPACLVTHTRISMPPLPTPPPPGFISPSLQPLTRATPSLLPVRAVLPLLWM
jgi:hypothetical protein